MRVVIQPSSGQIEGLGDAAGEMPLWTGLVAGATAGAVREAGMTALREDPGEGDRLVVGEGTAMGRHTLRAAAAAGQAAGRDARFRLSGRTGELVDEVLRGRSTGVTYLHGGGAASTERLSAAEELDLDPAEQSGCRARGPFR